ncbi:MAG: glycosyltransferase family 4 protein [Verrucomicrobia bacterium]|nr:glycosyltransferase family 4 protein [Verrucomicrobiota bacterium]
MKAIVTGMIASYPVGGVLWDYAQYALGLERLGYEVYYLEDTGWQTYDPRRGEYGEDGRYGVEFLGASLARLSPTLGRRWHFRCMDGQSFGVSRAELAKVVACADVFLNVSGGTLLREEYMPCRRKVLIDTDPGWNHFRNFPRWDAQPGWQGSNGYRAHDYFFTYAERLGEPDCVLPDMGLRWQPTRPPAVLDLWQAEPPGEQWSTVLTWKNFAETIRHQSVTYGTKEMEFGKVQELPRRVPARFELAVGGAAAPVEAWRGLGWSVVEAQGVSGTLEDYRHYVQRSRGEFSVAKNVYVATRSGWFSCRSVCYLAAGRPVVVQDTGFSDFIPTGEGLFAFADLDGAVRGIEAVEADYARHQQGARQMARAHFDSDRVLGDLLRGIGL